ncbi:MAG: TolC family protein [Flavobacteriales bacterium]|nr:TolC family protein [Flavobacteriales bacterium]
MPNRIPYLALTIILCAMDVCVFAQSQSMTLQQAQDFAMRNAFVVKNAGYDAQAAKLQTAELIGIGFPQISGSLQYQNYIDLPTSIIPGDFFGEPGQDVRLQFGTPHNMTVGLSVSQLLFDGSWLVGLEAARAYADLKQKQVEQSQVQLEEAVAQAYHLAVIADRNVELLRESGDVLTNSLKEVSAMFNEGFTEQQDVDQLQLSVNDLNNRIAYSEQQQKMTLDLLKFRIGMPIAEELSLAENADALLAIAINEQGALPFIIENNIDLKVQTGALAMQHLNLKNQKTKLLPSLGAFYNLQSQALRNDFDFLDTGKPWFPIQLWGVQLNVPIFSGMSKQKSIDRARVEVQRMTDMVSLLRESLQLEYNSAKTEYDYALINYNSSKSSLELAEKILTTTNIKFKEGLNSSFEVSQHQSQVLAAQGSFIDSMLKLLNAKTRMMKAVG